ncbi:E1-like protein-activating [Rickenella mellea]|uniref:Ubiquitin-like modifier-activating enzyme ATG7 n=1 Tax=Rickenella mellea TaxID=50990 RepID=A0A4Y7QJ74_9AGAM|nr:E1-like protein-activating [Rickenella mellea]
MTVVQFTPFSSLVQPAFWHELTRLKIDVLKLSEESLPITASYSVGRSITDRETGQEVALGCNLTISDDSFNDTKTLQRLPANSVRVNGTFKNFNTIEEFKEADKSALFNQTADEIWNGIKATGDISLLNRFLLITFADLKKYRYYYWFAFPAFVAKPAWSIDDAGWKSAEEHIGRDALSGIHTQLQSSPSAYFLARPRSSEDKTDSHNYEIAPISSLDSFFANTPAEQQIIGFVDPSPLPQNPGWPLRNLLTFLRIRKSTLNPIRVLCWRDVDIPASGKPWKSRFGIVQASVSEAEGDVRPAAVGWEKNPQGKMAPRMADLAPMMDPSRLADQAVDLNLKLMRWRILPALDLEKVAATRCLLLGAGTLGCYVARTLMGWGVRTITFVDSARVSFSNPVRQPLFEFNDCLNGGKPKAECAAESLKRIFPGVNATGISMSIPMPGHPVPPSSVEQVKKDVEELEKLFDQHDAIFLLMDSRESRWLPTVLGAAKGKIVMNAALGFDTYLVMRHGARGKPGDSSASATAEGGRLGCYYCNDIVAPADSLTDRTLDQMCTVTRPGLASIASSTAVELLVSLLQHPDGVNARAPPPNAGDDPLGETSPYRSVLGLVPHQLRGFLAQFRTMPIVGAAYDRCTGCSETMLRAYETQGFDMMLKAFNEPGYLESLTGLDKLHDEGEAALENVDWEDDDEGEGF